MEGRGGVGVSEEQHSRWTKLRRVRDDPGMSALLRQPERPGRFIRYHSREEVPGAGGPEDGSGRVLPDRQ